MTLKNLLQIIDDKDMINVYVWLPKTKSWHHIISDHGCDLCHRRSDLIEYENYKVINIHNRMVALGIEIIASDKERESAKQWQKENRDK